jgi:hypothetical protein
MSWGWILFGIPLASDASFLPFLKDGHPYGCARIYFSRSDLIFAKLNKGLLNLSTIFRARSFPNSCLVGDGTCASPQLVRGEEYVETVV